MPGAAAPPPHPGPSFSPRHEFRMRRAVRRTLILLVLIAAVSCGSAMLYGGRFLQHEDPVRSADAIFVLAGSTVERVIEAISLYREGYARVMLLSPGRVEEATAAALAMGVRFPSGIDGVYQAVIASGLSRDAVLVGTGSVDNTAAEGAMLRSFATARGWRTVIVVTSKYHTRRSGFAMRRALEGTGVTVIMRASRYDPSDPAHWWRRRRDVRFLMEEWPKLIAYRIGLGE